MTEHVHVHEILIDRSVDDVYAYVTQPWRWHEWHPASESASRSQGALETGVRFDEVASMKPFPMLPLRIRSQLQWTVLKTRAPNMVELKGRSKLIDVHVRYEIDGVDMARFRRVFRFQVKGWLRHIEAYFLPARMHKQSVAAIFNLRRVLEAQPQQGGGAAK
jgi:hypothetical protein